MPAFFINQNRTDSGIPRGSPPPPSSPVGRGARHNPTTVIGGLDMPASALVGWWRSGTKALSPASAALLWS
jgi:hypothetical protein